jgi:protein-S-isoprenylcysteine O-methyltransferase Ste14
MEQQVQQSVHKVLAQSYLVFFILCAVGLFVDTLFPLTIVIPFGRVFAIGCFGVGPLLIAWAQYTSHRFEIIKQQTGKTLFNSGPYRYLRNPTQLGLVILTMGYALVSQATALFLATFISYLISNIFFKRHEAILAARYGQPYLDYKASVSKIL